MRGTQRCLEVVPDDSALIAVIVTALAAQLDLLEKIRERKVLSAGAVTCAAMKAMQGKADAARVRELLFAPADSPMNSSSVMALDSNLECVGLYVYGLNADLRALLGPVCESDHRRRSVRGLAYRTEFSDE